ncbi:MAG: hypothetical protein QM737_07755 [Ferruginibacter sp.]
MLHLYTYNQKPTGTKSSYKTLFSFFGKLLFVILITLIVMLINISKSSAEDKSGARSYDQTTKAAISNTIGGSDF